MAWNEPPTPPGWDQPSIDPWGPPGDTTGLPDPWAEPDPGPAQLRWSLSKCRAGFTLLVVPLTIACLSLVGALISIFVFGQRPQPMGVLLGIPNGEFIEESLVVWTSLVGAAMIWGRWPDESWRQRSGLFLMMCFVDLLLWGLDHAKELGLTDAAHTIGHEWLRTSIGQGMGWAEMALIAGLASDMASRQGEAGALGFGKAARSLAVTGGGVWVMLFFMRTNWHPPIWPLRVRPNQGSVLILLITWVLAAINLFQLCILCFMASWSCGQTLRRMDPDVTSHDLLISPSDAAWKELDESRSKRGF